MARGFPPLRKWAPKNTQKYMGDPTKIVARSSWEVKFFNYCDNSPSVIRWVSEGIKIPYICKTDNQRHNYSPDVFMEVRDSNGKLTKYLVEIKPAVQLSPPNKPKRPSEKAQSKYLNETLTYLKNNSKWEAAKDFCQKNGIQFMTITEKELAITTGRSKTNGR